ncbi:UbiA family prenyltransferase [Streptomyces albus subsp. chlorinus]|uniref:UbiA family prenyltransferase n=1 Tax=Streptomyces albus TaxID=1888 RepID=UPI003D132DCA
MTRRERAAAWAQLLRVSALFTVPGDALAGAAARGRAPTRGTALAAACSLCLYEAGMALNDWADREEDARERPERPLPSGRVRPAAALAAAGGLTATGLALAARAGRLPLTVATALAATVWAYDLRLKHTPAGPATMAAARFLDVTLGATATAPANEAPAPDPRPTAPTGRTAAPAGPASRVSRGRASVLRRRVGVPIGLEAGGGSGVSGGLTSVSRVGAAVWRGRAVMPAAAGSRTGSAAPGGGASVSSPRAAVLRAAALVGVHTFAVTVVSRREERGGAPAVPLGALGVVGAVAGLLARSRAPLEVAASAVYAATASRPLAHAALNPSPPLLRRAVGGGIRAMIPLQAALAARACGAARTARAAPHGGGDAASTAAPAAASTAALLALLPVSRRLSRKVSPT